MHASYFGYLFLKIFMMTKSFYHTLLYLFCLYTTIQAQIDSDTTLFRVIAPQIICAKNNESAVDRPDTTTVMIQTKAGTQLTMSWTVRWLPLRAPSQRFILLLWRSVRNLEEKLNKKQPEPFIYVIDNKELLMDVDYVFTVTGISGNNSIEQKSFRVNNISGKKKLELTEGYAEKYSLILLGSEITYSSIEYIIEAQVTMCNPTQDYQFIWLLHDVDTDVDIHSTIIGSKLMVPPGDLKAGHKYDITCEVIRSSDQIFINQMKFSVQVLHRGLGVSLSSDYLVISTDNAFVIEAAIFNDDYLSEIFHYDWWCKYEEEPCVFFQNINNNIIEISGLPVIGMYEFGISASSGDYMATASILVEAIEPRLPVLKVTPIRRLVNEGSKMSLVGNATNIAPACSLTWYFSSSLNSTNDTCEDCQHGEQIADTIIIHSLEENFLNELADFTNETEWRQITAEILAQPGRARLVAECGCSLSFNCDTAGMAYADLNFEINKSPVIGDVTVSPDSGLALETLFTIRTKDAQDDNLPLRYSFYAAADVNVSVILNSYLGHLALETVLPYFDGMTTIWVEVCDSLGACSRSEEMLVPVAFAGISPEKLAETALGHLKRCELIELERLFMTSLLSLKNAAQRDGFELLSAKLHEVMETSPSEQCIQDSKKQFENVLKVLHSIGYDNLYI